MGRITYFKLKPLFDNGGDNTYFALKNILEDVQQWSGDFLVEDSDIIKNVYISFQKYELEYEITRDEWFELYNRVLNRYDSI